jgi:hypothetical protein
MASTELLSSKVVILEEEPSIPNITALPSAVLLALGITERGPIADRTLLTSFQEYSDIFGGFTATSEVAIAMHGFFYNGGSFAWVSRTCHFTDLTDPSTYIATKGTKTLQNSGTAASPAVVGPGTDVAPFSMDPGDHIDIDVGSGPVVATFAAAPADITDTATYPIGPLTGGETMGVTIAGANGGNEQTVTAAGGETTAVDIAALCAAQLAGCKAEVVGGQVKLTTDRQGTGASIQVTTGGTLNAILAFPTAADTGTGDVFDIDPVTKAEAQAKIEGEVGLAGNVLVTYNGSDQMIITTVATGASAEIQVEVASTVNFGLDNTPHNGADATPEDTLRFDGKTPGAYTGNITIAVENASNGEAEFFNLKFLVSGVVKETFPNVTMDQTNTTDYVETRVNHATQGSNLLAATDLLLAYSALLKRPANQTTSAMTGGDDGLTGLADSDYIGNEAGPTGLFCFDRVSTGRILIVPGVYTPAVHLAMIDYAENHRNGTMFCILDCPPQQTAVQVIDYVDTNGLLELSEYAAIYWPWIKVVNPSPAVFGTDDYIAVAPSGWIAGKYASNDQKIGGIYESPAGVGGGFGVIRGMVGVEDDPGGSETHEVLDEKKRDLVYPKRINPISKDENQPWAIDGGRTLKSTSNFPNVGERRGVIFIETSIQAGLLILKHRFNNKENRRKAERIITAFLVREMNKDAFRSRNPATAFFVDASDKLNPLANEFAGIMTIRVGLATNKPAEFIVVLVTQDTRAFTEALAA